MLHSVHKVILVMPNGCRIVFISLHSHGILWWAVPRPGCHAYSGSFQSRDGKSSFQCILDQLGRVFCFVSLPLFSSRRALEARKVESEGENERHKTSIPFDLQVAITETELFPFYSNFPSAHRFNDDFAPHSFTIW